eukprot:2207994-Alexandrium_andersonii.AAC.1
MRALVARAGGPRRAQDESRARRARAKWVDAQSGQAGERRGQRWAIGARLETQREASPNSCASSASSGDGKLGIFLAQPQ